MESKADLRRALADKEEQIANLLRVIETLNEALDRAQVNASARNGMERR